MSASSTRVYNSTGCAALAGLGGYMPPDPDAMTAAAAGAFFKELRTKRGLRLADVVEGTTVPNVPYLSSLEKGRYNVLNSEHFASLVRFFGLSSDQIKSMKPDAFIEVQAMYAPNPPFDIQIHNQDGSVTYVDVKLNYRISGITQAMSHDDTMTTPVKKELADRELGGLVMDKTYIREIPAGFYALWSKRQANPGELVVVEKEGALYPAFLLADGMVEVDTAINAATAARFRPDHILGAIEEIRLRELPRRQLS